MVQLLDKNGGGSDWRGWALSVAILIIAGVAGLFSALSMSMIKDFRNEVLTEFKENRIKNHDQDLCLEQVKMQQDRFKEIQDERLRREGKK